MPLFCFAFCAAQSNNNMDLSTTILLLAAVFCVFMAWGIGANDVANAMATSVGSRALSLKQAVYLAAIFEFLGAYLAGGQVTATIRKGIVEADTFSANPYLLVYGMLASLLAAGCWLAIASYKGWPVSTTHSIVGAVVGFAAVGMGPESVNWQKVAMIATTWVTSPLMAGIISFVIYHSINRLVLESADPVKNAVRYCPFYLFLVGFVLVLVTIKKGLKHIGLGVSNDQGIVLAILVGMVVAAIGAILIRRLHATRKSGQAGSPFNVEKIFALSMVFTASGMAFAHGSNDVANAVGPMAAIVGVLQSGQVGQTASLPHWVLLIGAFGIVLGLATYGYRVINTVGSKVIELSPSRGFSAEIAAAITVVFASYTGVPISTTHTLVGAILGVGFACAYSSVDFSVVRRIIVSWLVTLPAGAALSITFFFIFKNILGGIS